MFLALFMSVFVDVFSQSGRRPDQFPVDNTVSDTDAFYTQEAVNGIPTPRKIYVSSLREVLQPNVNSTPISYVPTVTGNTQNRGEFVIDPNNDRWYIDQAGRALLFAGGSGGAAQSLALANKQLTITSGNTVDLSPLADTAYIVANGSLLSSIVSPTQNSVAFNAAGDSSWTLRGNPLTWQLNPSGGDRAAIVDDGDGSASYKTGVEEVTLGYNTSSSIYRLGLAARNTGSAGVQRTLYLYTPLDEDTYPITIQSGLTAQQRRYFEYLDHAGVRTNLLGVNNNNSLIFFDAANGAHPLIASSEGNSDSPTRLSSPAGTQNAPVRINWDAANVLSSGGLSVHDGSGLGTGLNNTYFQTNGTFSAFTPLQTYFYHPNKTDVLTINQASSGRSIVESTLPLDLQSPTNVRARINGVLSFDVSGAQTTISNDLVLEGGVKMEGLPSGTAANQLYIDPITKEIYEGVTAGGAGSIEDSTRLVQDSILVYYQGAGIVRQDTIRLSGGSSAGGSVWTSNGPNINYTAGNVSIGTTTAGPLLNVFDSNVTEVMQITGGTGRSIGFRGEAIDFKRAGSSYISASDPSGGIILGGGGLYNNHLKINSSGNITIGGGSEAYKLNVTSSNSIISQFVNGSEGLRMFADAGGSGVLTVNNTGFYTNSSSGNFSYLKAGGGGSIEFRGASNFFGINVASPLANLHVDGTIRFEDFANAQFVSFDADGDMQVGDISNINYWTDGTTTYDSNRPITVTERIEVQSDTIGLNINWTPNAPVNFDTNISAAIRLNGSFNFQTFNEEAPDLYSILIDHQIPGNSIYSNGSWGGIKIAPTFPNGSKWNTNLTYAALKIEVDTAIGIRQEGNSALNWFDGALNVGLQGINSQLYKFQVTGNSNFRDGAVIADTLKIKNLTKEGNTTIASGAVDVQGVLTQDTILVWPANTSMLTVDLTTSRDVWGIEGVPILAGEAVELKLCNTSSIGGANLVLKQYVTSVPAGSTAPVNGERFANGTDYNVIPGRCVNITKLDIDDPGGLFFINGN